MTADPVARRMMELRGAHTDGRGQPRATFEQRMLELRMRAAQRPALELRQARVAASGRVGPLPTAAEALYASPNPDGSVKACRNCMMWSRDERCSIHAADLRVKGSQVCGLHVFGDAMPERMAHPGMKVVVPEESGLISTPDGAGTSCGGCQHFSPTSKEGGLCAAVTTEDHQDMLPVAKMGCCARWAGRAGVELRARRSLPLETRGDLPGHPFRGNQYVDAEGGGGAAEEEQPRAPAVRKERVESLRAKAKAVDKPLKDRPDSDLSPVLRKVKEGGWPESLQRIPPPDEVEGFARQAEVSPGIALVEDELDGQKATASMKEGAERVVSLYPDGTERVKYEGGEWDAERKERHAEIVEALDPDEARPPAGEKPVAVFLMGYPSSGKTTSLRGAFGEDFKYASVSADDARAMLPGFDGYNGQLYHQEAQEVAYQGVLDRARQRGHNVVIDHIGSRPEEDLAMMKSLSEQGYKVRVVYADVPHEVSVWGTTRRFYEGGRYIPIRAVMQMRGDPEAGWDRLKEAKESGEAPWLEGERLDTMEKVMRKKDGKLALKERL